MPIYEVDIEGQGTFEVESDQELSDDQVKQAALSQLGPSQAPQSAQAPTTTTTATPAEASGFLANTGRRVMEAGQAAMDIPSNLAGVVTGGEQGRFQAALNLLRGVAAPISIITSPVEGAVEATAESLGAPKEWAKLGGDVGGMVGTLGLGLLAKAGKLGPYAEQLAKVLGVGRAELTVAEQIKHDPQLGYILGRGDEAVGKAISPIEELTRADTSLEDLALALKSPELAESLLQQRKMKADAWQKLAKEGQFIDEIPEQISFSPKELVEFQAKEGKDAGFFSALGTPTNVAARINPLAAQASYELALAEMNLKQAVDSRAARVDKALGGVDDKMLRTAVAAREAGLKPANPELQRLMQFMEDKFEVDRSIIVPRMREAARERITKQVTRELQSKSDIWKENLDPKLVEQAVDEKLKKAVPDNWGLDDYLPHIFPGNYKILDENGKLLGDATTKWEAKMMIRDLALDGADAAKIRVESKSYFDSDLLRFYKGRVSRTIDSIAKGAGLSADEIEAAAKGDYNFKGETKFFGNLLERQGKATGYSRDLKTIMNLYDRGIERWMQLTDASAKVAPLIKELGARGYPGISNMLEHSLQRLWGYRSPVSQLFDNTLQAIPVVNQLVAPMFMERAASGLKNGIVSAFLRYNPRFHAVNATQTLSTLWPIASAQDMQQGLRFVNSQIGQDLIKKHIMGGSKIEGFSKSLGYTEKLNQELAFATMYNKARKMGLNDQQAADYAKLRGNLYTQFFGLTTDTPYAFSKIDPTGVLTLFQRFPVKQLELVMDVIKDRNFPAAAKWMGVNLALGGFKAASLGQAGWLTKRLYDQISQEYGSELADVFHTGLPSMVGIDLSNSVMLWNPPFGENWQEKLGNLLGGVTGSLVSSVTGAAANQAGPEPNAVKRAFDALVQRVPLAKQLDSLRRLWEEDYDFKDPAGRLRFKGDASDAIKGLLGARSSKQALEDTYIQALMQVRESRDSVLNYAASRWGQARAAGIPLSQDMDEAVRKDVDNWNQQWPEFPISGTDIQGRAKSRMQAASQTLRERMLKASPKVIRQSEAFSQDPLAIPPPAEGF